MSRPARGFAVARPQPGRRATPFASYERGVASLGNGIPCSGAGGDRLLIQALADLEASAGDYERAALLVGAAETERRRAGLILPGTERTAAEQTMRLLQRQLDASRMAELVSRGSALNLEEAAASQVPSSTL